MGIRHALFKVLVLAIVLSTPCAVSIADEAADKAYVDLVEKARRAPAGTDYSKLRRAYASSKFYRRYDSDPQNILAARLLGGKEPSEAGIKDYVRDNFALPGAHLVAIGKLGLKVGTSEFELHKTVHVKLLEAIITSGRGLSKDDAIEVLVPSEENLVCAVLGVKVQNQALVSEGNSSFDVLTVHKAEWRKPIKLWFDVTSLRSP
jgi:hypothetical protein